MKSLKKIEFTTELHREGSWGSQKLGTYATTMEVYGDSEGIPELIEWDIPDLDETEHIGLEIDGNNVTGYDGVMSIPREAVELLKSMGYNTDEIE